MPGQLQQSSYPATAFRPAVLPHRTAQVWWEDGGLHILMDYVDLSLAFLLERLGPLQERILSHISLQMLHGMHGLRQTGLVHQDINAENILVGYNGMVRLCGQAGGSPCILF